MKEREREREIDIEKGREKFEMRWGRGGVS